MLVNCPMTIISIGPDLSIDKGFCSSLMQRLRAYFQQFGRLQRNARLYLINTALTGVTTGIFLVLYNLYLTSLGYKTDFVGATLFAGTLGAGLAIFPAGYLVDRISNKWILIDSSALIGLVGIGTILFRQPFPLLCAAFIAGVAAAFFLVINAPFLTRNSVPSERPYLFSFNIVLAQITVVMGEVLGGALPTWFLHIPAIMGQLPPGLNYLLASQPEPRSYQLALLFAGLIAAPGFLPLFGMSNSPLPQVSERPQTVPGPTWRVWLKRERLRELPAYLRAFVRGPFFVLILVQALTGLGAGLIVPYFSLFFVRHLNASPALFGLIDGAANGLTALTTLLAPWLALKVGRVRSLMYTRLCSLPILLTIGLTPSLPLAASLYPLRQGTMDMSQGVLLVFSMEEVEEKQRGLANSAYQAVYQICWAITSSLGGLVILYAGYSPLFIGAAICYLSTILLLGARFQRKKPVSQS